MQLEIASRDQWQFFTPYSACQLMADAGTECRRAAEDAPVPNRLRACQRRWSISTLPDRSSRVGRMVDKAHRSTTSRSFINVSCCHNSG